MNTSNRAKRPSIWILIGSMAFVLSVWGLSWLLISHLIKPDDQGPFGDQFGAVNALFSGLAFAVLIYTMRLQSTELALQREELESTREVLIGQEKQLREQTSLLSKQRVEETFFKTLSMIQPSFAPQGTFGLDLEFSETFNYHMMYGSAGESVEARIAELFKGLGHRFQPYMVLFRTIEAALSLAQNPSVAAEKAFYIRLVLNQLRSRELRSLAVYLTTEGRPVGLNLEQSPLADQVFREFLADYLLQETQENWKDMLARLVKRETQPHE